MKFKKVIGCLLLALTAVFVNTGNTSLAFVGVEDMPKSMKENRQLKYENKYHKFSRYN